MDVSVIIPTRNAEKYIDNLINRLLKQTIQPKEIIIIDTASQDKTKEICSKYEKVKFIGIKNGEFDHGGTRNKAARQASGDILIFMTQDAYPENNIFIEELSRKLGQDNIAASYGRQKARENAQVLERFAREFNYKDEDDIKSIKDVDRLGIKTFFLTNVCSAFLKDEFWKVEGFPEKTILNEDMIISCKLMNLGKKVHYASKATVIHSHEYTYMQQFKRNFDIGVAFKQNKDILSYASSESEGVKFVSEAAKYLMKDKKPHLIPNLVMESGFKFIGYKIGLMYEKLPKKIVKKLSMHSFFWN